MLGLALTSQNYINKRTNKTSKKYHIDVSPWVGWLVGCFGLNGPLRHYISLYRVVSQREGERKEMIDERVKMSKDPPPAPSESAVGPCPAIIEGPVVQNIVSLTSSLRGQLVKCSMTL